MNDTNAPMPASVPAVSAGTFPVEFRARVTKGSRALCFSKYDQVTVSMITPPTTAPGQPPRMRDDVRVSRAMAMSARLKTRLTISKVEPDGSALRLVSHNGIDAIVVAVPQALRGAILRDREARGLKVDDSTERAVRAAVGFCPQAPLTVTVKGCFRDNQDICHYCGREMLR